MNVENNKEIRGMKDINLYGHHTEKCTGIYDYNASNKISRNQKLVTEIKTKDMC